MISPIAALKRWIFARMAIGPNVVLGRNVHIGPFSVVSAARNLRIGENTYIGKFCTIQVNGLIGRGVLIANSVGVVGRRDHLFRPAGMFVRDGAWIGSDKELAEDPMNTITIGDDVWIGYGSTILSGIEIGRGAIISAGSVVRNDVEPFAIVTGNPATMIARRFNDHEALRHDAALSFRYDEGMN